jgi:SulP family sulfate permease
MTADSNQSSTSVKFLPFLAWWPLVNKRCLRADLIAGLTGAIIVLPQGVAYALIAGLPPQYGLYTAIVTPIIAGLFGSSRHLVSGPTAAISIIVLSVISGVGPQSSTEFISIMLTLTLMVGIIQFALGLARMGTLVNFISHTVVVGFTAGAAVLIATSQLSHLLSLTEGGGHSFIASLIAVAKNIGATNPWSLAIGLITLCSAVLIRYWRPKWPNMLMAMLIGSAVCLLFESAQQSVTMVGAMPRGLPPPGVPDLSPGVLRDLAPGALAVAVIALIEAVSIGRAVALRSHQQINGNQEFVGQSLSNIVRSFFSCYPGSGSFTRSGANYDAGAQTPMAAIFASLILALVLLLIPGITGYLPMPAMAGIVMLIAWNLIDFHHIRQIVRASRGEMAVLVVTFASTLVLQLEFAIYVGVLVSLILQLQRTSRPLLVDLAPVPDRDERPLRNAALRDLSECPQLRILRIDGALFFGAVDRVQTELKTDVGRNRSHVLIIGNGISLIDVAGGELLAQEAQRLRAMGGGLYLCGIKPPVLEMVRRGGYLQIIGEENCFSSPKEAIKTIFTELEDDICRRCTQRIFLECANVPGAEQNFPASAKGVSS